MLAKPCLEFVQPISLKVKVKRMQTNLANHENKSSFGDLSPKLRLMAITQW